MQNKSIFIFISEIVNNQNFYFPATFMEIILGGVGEKWYLCSLFGLLKKGGINESIGR
jgi:hypothetical protein